MPELTLSDRQSEDLRKRHPYWPDFAVILDLAQRAGWEQANRHYLLTERDRAAAAMRDLIEAVGIASPVPSPLALDLIELAVRTFTPDGKFTGVIQRDGPSRIRIVNCPCPGFVRMEEHGWLGVTACSSWHRRHGWYDALGVTARDIIEGDMGLGDPACVSIIEVTGSRAVADTPV